MTSASPRPTTASHGSADVGRGLALSAGAQAGAKVAHLALNVVSTLAIIHYLAPGVYGEYVLVLTTVMLVGLLADFGLNKLATREVAREADSEGEVLGTVLLARVLLALICVGLVQLVLLALGASAQGHAAAAIASLMYLGEAVLVVVVVFHVRLLQQYEALIRVGMEAFETGLVLILIARGASLATLFIAPALATGLGAVAALIVVRWRFGVRFSVAPHRVRYLLREALPIGPGLFIAVCYLKLDSLVLAAKRPSSDVGIYGSAVQPIEYAFLAAAVVVNVAFPLLSQAWSDDDHDRFVSIYRGGTEVLLGLMVLAPVLAVVVGPHAVTAIYGPAYAEAAQPLRLLAVALVLMTLNGWQALVLLSGGRQKITLGYNVAALGVAALVAFPLVAWLGMMGAASASLATAVFVLVCSTVAVSRLLDARLDLSRLARLAGAVAGMVATMAALTAVGAPWGVVAGLGLLTYPGWIMAFGVLRPSQLKRLSRTHTATPADPDIDLTVVDAPVPQVQAAR